jgi:hypothetical protein
MTRGSPPVGRTLRTLVACGLVAFVLHACGARREAGLSPAPLQVSALWWSPTSLRYGIRSLHGRVTNSTDSVWTNVQVSIEFTGTGGESLYVKTIPMGSIEPRASAEFATGALPERPIGYALRALCGTSVVERRKLAAR